MSLEVLSFEDALIRQSQIACKDSKSICTNFCKSSFLSYHKDRSDSNFSTIFLSDTCENNSFILPVSFLLTDPNNLVSHLGSPYAGMCINSDQPEKIKSAYDLCFSTINKMFPNISSLEIRLPPAIVCKSTPIHEWALWSLGCTTKVMYLGRYFSSTNKLKLNRNRNRRIDKIDKSNMEIIFNKTPSSEAFKVLIENRKKRHSVAPIHTLEDLQRIESCIPGILKSFQVRHSSKICSVAIIFEDSEFATIQYLAGSDCSFECGSQDLLVLHLIENYLATHKFLLFGTSSEPFQNHRTINSGLDNYKGSFGANAYVSSRLTKVFD